MKKFPQWKGIYLAWYSKDFYSDVVLNWRGLAIGYVAIFLLCLWVPVAVKLQFEVDRYANQFLFPIIDQIPDLNLKEDRLRMKEKSPYVIENPKSGKPIMIFDLREDAPRPDKSLNGVFFIGNKEIFQYEGKSTEFELSGDWQEKLVPDSLKNALDNIRQYAGITFFLTFAFYSLIAVLAQIFVFGFIGFISAGLLKRALTYPQTGRIAAIALIPQITLDVAQRLFSFQFPLWIPLALLLTLGYLIYGIKSVSVTFNRPTVDPDRELIEAEDVEFSTNSDS